MPATGTMGSIMLVGFNYAPVGWLECAGQSLEISKYTALFSIIGVQFGGDGRIHFNLPDLRSRVPVAASSTILGTQGGDESVGLDVLQMPQHTHFLRAGTGVNGQSDPDGMILATDKTGTVTAYVPLGSNSKVDMAEHAVDTIGGGRNHSNIQLYLAMKYVICVDGYYPPHPEETEQDEPGADAEAPVSYGASAESEAAVGSSGESYLGEIRIFPYALAPRGWAKCDGQLLNISAFQVLYSLLGATYGGAARRHLPCRICADGYRLVPARAPASPTFDRPGRRGRGDHAYDG